jgi:hypothetical protein
MSTSEKQKRTADNLSAESSFEEEFTKKSREDPSNVILAEHLRVNTATNKMSKNNSEFAILIQDGGDYYAQNPNQLKKDFDSLKMNIFIKETKITLSKHLIIIFTNNLGREKFMDSIKNSDLFKNKKIIDLSKRKSVEIVIKGLNFKSYDNYQYDLAKIGITKILQMNKANEEFRMIRAECIDNVTKEKLIKEGLKIDHFNLKVEEYIKPIRPLQCFNCQQFDHIASNCPIKDTPICIKCGGSHKAEACNSSELKCVNCHQDHTSIYKLCPIYQDKLEEKMKKLASYSQTPDQKIKRLYSQVSSSKPDLEVMQSTIIDSLKVNIESMQESINDSIRTQISAFELSLKSSINLMESKFELQKAKQMFLNTDILRIMNIPPNTEQIRAIHEAAKFHGVVDFNLLGAIKYNKNAGYKAKNNDLIKYQND